MCRRAVYFGFSFRPLFRVLRTYKSSLRLVQVEDIKESHSLLNQLLWLNSRFPFLCHFAVAVLYQRYSWQQSLNWLRGFQTQLQGLWWDALQQVLHLRVVFLRFSRAVNLCLWIYVFHPL